MQIKEILLEYNLQNLLSLFQEKYKEIRDKDPSNKHETLNQFIKSIENPLKQQNKFQFIDPYMKWIVQRYITGKLNKYEDVVSKVIPGLLKYDSLKRKNKLKPEHKDINQIKDINHLLDILDEYKEESTLSNKEREKEIEKNFYKTGEAILLHNDSEFKVVIPKSERASCFFGRNTRWCTAARENNYFERYNSEGDLYIIIVKKENKRFQFHFEEMQFMDEKDSPISILEFRKKYPKLEKFFSKIEQFNHKTRFFKDLDDISEKEIVDFFKININDGFELLKKKPEVILKKDIIDVLKYNNDVKEDDLFEFIIDLDIDTNDKKHLIYELLDKIMLYFYNNKSNIELLIENKEIKELFNDFYIKKKILSDHFLIVLKYFDKAFLINKQDIKEILSKNKLILGKIITNLIVNLEIYQTKVLKNFLTISRIVLDTILEYNLVNIISKLFIYDIFKFYSVWVEYQKPTAEDDKKMKKILELFFNIHNYDSEQKNDLLKNLRKRYSNLSYFFDKFEE